MKTYKEIFVDIADLDDDNIDIGEYLTANYQNVRIINIVPRFDTYGFVEDYYVYIEENDTNGKQ